MPSIPDWSREDEDLPSIGSAPGSSVGGLSSSPRPVAPTRSGNSGAASSAESGPVPWERFVSANKDVSEREAGKLKAGVQSSINTAEQGREDASNASEAASLSNFDQQEGASFGASSSGFGGGGETKGAMGGVEKEAASAPAALKLKESSLTAPQGAPNLEAQLGADKWAGLLGDTAQATQEAKALGSEGGVQAMLGKQTGVSDPFDAALISGAGGEDFRGIAQEYGGDKLGNELIGANQSAMDRWQSLMGEIQTAGLAQDAEATATNDAVATQDSDAARKGIQDHLDYLNQNFPTLGMAKDKDTLLAWMNANSRGTGAEHSQQVSWANSIYGPDVTKQLGNQGVITKFYQDIQKMTPEEFAMFAQGFVPPWMGLGQNAMGSNGGFWWGFRNSNTQVGAGGAGDPSKLSPEKRKEYEAAMKGLGVFYQVLAAVATGAATAAGGPAAGAAVGAATSAGLQGQKAATGAGL